MKNGKYFLRMTNGIEVPLSSVNTKVKLLSIYNKKNTKINNKKSKKIDVENHK